MKRMYLNFVKNREGNAPHFIDYVDYIGVDGLKDGKKCQICEEYDKIKEACDTRFVVRDILNNKDVTLSKKQHDAIIAAANELVERAEANGLFAYTNGFAWDKVDGKNTIILSVRRTITNGFKMYQWMLDIR